MRSFIDTHVHLWDLKNSYSWITNNKNKNIIKNYLINDLEDDADIFDLKKIVHIQAEIDTKNKILETKWLQEISDNHPLKFPNAIIGYVNLLDINVEADIENHIKYKNFRGVRQILKSINKQDNYLLNDHWIKNFELIKKFNLSFDMLIYYKQYNEAIELIKKYNDVQIIINHSLWPQFSENDFLNWKNSVEKLSRFENVSIKISGFGEWQNNWTIKSIENYVNVIIKYFGTKRSMFASNFPVDKFISQSTYESFWTAYFKIIDHLSEDEKNDLLIRNAERIYRI